MKKIYNYFIDLWARCYSYLVRTYTKIIEHMNEHMLEQNSIIAEWICAIVYLTIVFIGIIILAIGTVPVLPFIIVNYIKMWVSHNSNNIIEDQNNNK